MASLNIVTQAVRGESLTGAIDGVNTVYTTASDFASGTEAVFFNGQRLTEGASNDYTRSESGGVGTGFDTVTLAVAPLNRSGARPDDRISIDYDIA